MAPLCYFWFLVLMHVRRDQGAAYQGVANSLEPAESDQTALRSIQMELFRETALSTVGELEGGVEV